jgi:hypothetical protein
LAERHSAQVRADPQDQLVLAADIIAGGKPADFRCFRFESSVSFGRQISLQYSSYFPIRMKKSLC